MSDTDDMWRAIKELKTSVAALHARLDSIEIASGKFVSDKELDGPRGSFRVPFSPRNWKGADLKGREIRDCPAEFCEVFAEFCEWSAAHPKPRPGREQYAARDAENERRRAALCRSWARRKRAGWVPPEQPSAGEFPGDEPAQQPAFDDFEAPVYEPPAPVGGGDDDIPF